MKYIGLIPARYNSSRFPGKVLCDIGGKSMIQRVYEVAKKWEHWFELYVITDSEIVQNECNIHAIPCLMTADTHLDCLDRAAEAAEYLNATSYPDDIKYVIIQGDEPLFNPKSLHKLLATSSKIINFYTRVKYARELYDPNVVKVITNEQCEAIYFSRHTLPYFDTKTARNLIVPDYYKQLGIYAFSRKALQLYTTLSASMLECAEGIGLNRLIEYGTPITMIYTEHDSISVDTIEDQQKVVEMLRVKK